MKKKEEVMIVDINKQYQTRDGKKVRIYCTDASGPYPVHGAVWSELDQCWQLRTWTAEGAFSEYVRFGLIDLVEVKPRIQRELWVNVYRDNREFFYPTRERADESKSPGRFACVKVVIDCEEGEGL